VFGGQLELEAPAAFLSAMGEDSARRLLLLFSLEHPELQFAPALPPALVLLLHFLSEAEAFTAMHLLLVHQAKPGHIPEEDFALLTPRYISTTQGQVCSASAIIARGCSHRAAAFGHPISRRPDKTEAA
jgi:hypothetical protein